MTTSVAADLPIHLTRFVGREEELTTLDRLLASTRLLTLTGAGGSGKTRLASELATRDANRFDHVTWVDLTPVADERQVATQCADALHVTDRMDTSAVDAIVANIGTGRHLLVLDNCEHVVEACASLAESLLRACPALTIVATSREALGVPSETSWLVPPMVPAEATQLFVDRAQGVVATFQLTEASAAAVAEICRRLDGIPLAIELAAARVRALSPEQIAERLTDVFRVLGTGTRRALPRHRTLRGVIEWSHSLLTPREQLLLHRLGTFQGGFTLEAAESVAAGDPLGEEDILDGISVLVDKSLVVMDSGEGVVRYRLLETVRQFCVEQLAAAGTEDGLRTRHAQYFVEWMERIAPRLVGGEHEFGLLARVRADNDNIRAACAWCLASTERTELGLRFAASLFWYWYSTGQFHEGRTFIDAVLPAADDRDPRLAGGAWHAQGLLALAQGRLDVSRVSLTRAVELQQLGGDEEGACVALAKLGATHLLMGDLTSAEALLEKAGSAAMRFTPITQVFANFWRGWARLLRGDMSGARDFFDRNRSIGAVADHHTSVAHSVTMLGNVALAEGKVDEARSRFRDALRRHHTLDDVWGMMLDFEGMGAMAVACRDMTRAVVMLAGADGLRDRMGIALPAVAVPQHDALVAAARDALGAAWEPLHNEWFARPLHDVVEAAFDEEAGARSLTPASAHPALPAAEAPAPRPAPDAATPTTAGLAVDAMGALSVTVDGRVLEASAWGSARTRELLVFLLMHPEGRTKEQVGEVFWPDASPSQLRNSFHVTLHRLRKTLGHSEWIVVADDRYAVDAPALLRFDVAEFESALAAAMRSLRRQEAGAVGALERAIDLYRGDFMDGEPAGDWHHDARERLQSAFIDGLMALGAAQGAEERHARAIETYRRVLARDELHEDAVRELVMAQARSGDRTPALRTYQRYADRLRRELEAEPSPRLRALFDRLKAGQAP